MSGFPRPWALAGGWAADSWIGHQTRDHGDVDIVVFDGDQRFLFERLAGWNTLGGPDSEPHVPWDGSHLKPPAHIHARPPGTDGKPGLGGDGFDLEVILNAHSDDTWMLSDKPEIALPINACISASPAGIPALPPEIVMFFKATAYEEIEGYPRPRDEADFLALRALLPADRRDWLYRAIAECQPGHAWLPRLLE